MITGRARPQFLLLWEAWHSLEFSRSVRVPVLASGKEHLRPGPWKALRAGLWSGVKGKQLAYCCITSVTFGNK